MRQACGQRAHPHCCPRRPSARRRRPVPSHWPPPIAARRSRRRTRPDRDVPGPAGSRPTPPCSGRVARAPRTGGDRCPGCPARSRRRGSRRPPVPAPLRAASRCAPATLPDSAITVSSTIRTPCASVCSAASRRRWSNGSRMSRSRPAKSRSASSRWRAARDPAAGPSSRPIPSSTALVQRCQRVGRQIRLGPRKLKSAGLNRRVISQKARALRGHCVTTRPLAARK